MIHSMEFEIKYILIIFSMNILYKISFFIFEHNSKFIILNAVYYHIFEYNYYIIL